MRLTLSALLCAALITGPALAHDHRGDRAMPPPPPEMDMPPPPGYGAPYGGQMDPGPDPRIDPRWERMHGEWMARCGEGRARHDRHGDRDGCGYDGPPPYGYGYPGAYPGAYMGYAVPMVMVPVLRSKPCPQVTEEWVEEVVPVRRRLIPPRPRVVHDKRVPLNDKRVRVAPTKRIPY